MLFMGCDKAVCVAAGPMGPPAMLAPSTIAADVFLRACCRIPNSVLSLGWQATDYAMWTRQYSEDLIRQMATLVEKPLVPRRTTDDQTEDWTNDELAGELIAAVDVVRHITFAVFAPFALRSKQVLRNELLERFDNSSLCVYTGMGSLGISEKRCEQLKAEFDEQRLFMDVQVYHSCSFGGGGRCKEDCQIASPVERPTSLLMTIPSCGFDVAVLQVKTWSEVCCCSAPRSAGTRINA